jgi:hypothetical protein
MRLFSSSASRTKAGIAWRVRWSAVMANPDEKEAAAPVRHGDRHRAIRDPPEALARLDAKTSERLLIP